MEGGKNKPTCLHTWRCHSPPNCSAISKIHFYHMAQQPHDKITHLICKMLNGDVLVTLCEICSYLSRGPQCDGAVCWAAVTTCDFPHICCWYKWHALNEDTVFLIVMYLSVAVFCKDIMAVHFCHTDQKLDPALSVFSLWQQQFPSLTITLWSTLCSWYKWLITAMRHPVTLIYTNHTLPLWLLLNRINAGANVSGSQTQRA